MRGIESTGYAPPAHFEEPIEGAPAFSSDLASTVARAALRLEEEAGNRRELSRSGQRRALEMRQRAIEKQRDAARSKMIGAIVGAGLKLAGSAVSTAGSLSAGGSAAKGGSEASSSGGAAWAKGAAVMIEKGGDFTAAGLNHRAERERLDGEAIKGGADGLEAVAKSHRDRSEEAERSIERARGILERIVDGDHARAMAALRG